jgi:DNA-directed RNA polymerase specialized sigma24 family protein
MIMGSLARTHDHAEAVLTHRDTPGTAAQDPRSAQASAGQVKEQAEGYLWRALYNLAADGWRRRGRWRAKLTELHAQACLETGGEEVAVVDLRDELVRLLHQLPPRQRTVIVLRYWEQRTEAETAELLGCSQGAVKSAASRGLRRLRELAGPWREPGNGPARGMKSGPGTGIKLAEGRS